MCFCISHDESSKVTQTLIQNRKKCSEIKSPSSLCFAWMQDLVWHNLILQNKLKNEWMDFLKLIISLHRVKNWLLPKLCISYLYSLEETTALLDKDRFIVTRSSDKHMQRCSLMINPLWVSLVQIISFSVDKACCITDWTVEPHLLWRAMKLWALSAQWPWNLHWSRRRKKKWCVVLFKSGSYQKTFSAFTQLCAHVSQLWTVKRDSVVNSCFAESRKFPSLYKTSHIKYYHVWYSYSFDVTIYNHCPGASKSWQCSNLLPLHPPRRLFFFF